MDIKSKNSLTLHGKFVEYNPGSGAARIVWGWGAGRAGATGIIEAYEPGRKKSSLIIYVKATSGGNLNPRNLLNSVIDQVAFKLSAGLEEYIPPTK